MKVDHNLWNWIYMGGVRRGREEGEVSFPQWRDGRYCWGAVAWPELHLARN